jgi:hypothetical protein
VNGVPSIWFRDGQGFETVGQLDVDGDKISAIYIVRNPEKLAHLKLH